MSILTRHMKERLLNREKTHYGIYHDVETVLDEYSTTVLFNFIRDEGEMEVSLRAWLVKTIISMLMNWEKEAEDEI